jgi:DNA-binding response OmpR family regulator
LVNGARDNHTGVAAAPLVYLVDDDGDYREEMISGLSRLGLDIHGFADAATLYRAYAAKPSDIVVIDIHLEGEDGLSIATHLRAAGSVGIVMATGKGTADDRVDGLQRGADAYLVKPFEPRELAATIFALKKRLNAGQAALPSTPDWALIEGGWVLTDGVGRRLRLTTAEQRLLGRLFSERGKIVERSALVEAIGEDVNDFDYARLDIVTSRLRRRAQKAGMNLPFHAVRGRGFTFAD